MPPQGLFSDRMCDHALLQKIDAYYGDNPAPFFRLPKKKKKAVHAAYSGVFWACLGKRVSHFHIGMIRSYLPGAIYQKARGVYMRRRLQHVKRQIAWLEGALQDIQQEDVFYFSLDDVHERDDLMMGLIQKMCYYQDFI